jgi:hypothetical protein
VLALRTLAPDDAWHPVFPGFFSSAGRFFTFSFTYASGPCCLPYSSIRPCRFRYLAQPFESLLEGFSPLLMFRLEALVFFLLVHRFSLSKRLHLNIYSKPQNAPG